MEKKSPKRVTDAKEKTKEIINKEIGRKANKKIKQKLKCTQRNGGRKINID